MKSKKPRREPTRRSGRLSRGCNVDVREDDPPPTASADNAPCGVEDSKAVQGAEEDVARNAGHEDTQDGVVSSTTSTSGSPSKVVGDHEGPFIIMRIYKEFRKGNLGEAVGTIPRTSVTEITSDSSIVDLKSNGLGRNGSCIGGKNRRRLKVIQQLDWNFKYDAENGTTFIEQCDKSPKKNVAECEGPKCSESCDEKLTKNDGEHLTCKSSEF